MLRKTFLSILSATVLFAGTVQAQTVLTSGGVGVLQDAIDAATPGDTIILDTNGVFTGDLVITKTLTIEAAAGKTPSIINDGSTAPPANAGTTTSKYWGITFGGDAGGSRIGSVSGGLIQIYLDCDAGGTATAGTGTARPVSLFGFEELDPGSSVTIENVFATLTGERRAGRNDNFGGAAFNFTAFAEMFPGPDNIDVTFRECIFNGNAHGQPYQNPLGPDDRGRAIIGVRAIDTTGTLNFERTRIFNVNQGAVYVSRGNMEVNITDSEIGDDTGNSAFTIGNVFISSTNAGTSTTNIDGSVIWGGMWGAVTLPGTSAGYTFAPSDITINDSLIIGNLEGRSRLLPSSNGALPFTPGLGTARGAVNIHKGPFDLTIDHSDIVDITPADLVDGFGGNLLHAAAIEIQDDISTRPRNISITNSNLYSEGWHVLTGETRTTPGLDTIEIGWNNVYTSNSTATLRSSSWTTGTTLIGNADLEEDPQYADLSALDAATANTNLHGAGDAGSDIGSNNTFTGSVPVELGSFELF